MEPMQSLKSILDSLGLVLELPIALYSNMVESYLLIEGLVPPVPVDLVVNWMIDSSNDLPSSKVHYI